MICKYCNIDKEIDQFELMKTGTRRKKCKECKSKNDLERYWKNPDKYRSAARSYRKGRELELELKRHKLSIDQYNKMLKSQNNLCKICKNPEKERTKSRLSIDHDHSCCPGRSSCGKCIRGLLCSNCNNGLGRFKDNFELLRRAAEYVSSFEQGVR